MRSLQTDAEIIGSVYGRLTVTGRSGRRDRYGVTFWSCRCECGGSIETPLSALRKGRTKSCGCLMLEVTAAINKTHGKTDTREYAIWSGMKARCYNPNNRVYRWYGGRGIVVCDRWRHSFENFLADVGYPPDDGQTYSIDRIDPNGNYEPGNVRWATREVQDNNKRSSVLITAFGRTQTLAQWSREVGLHQRMISARINNLGWSAEDALRTKPGNGRRRSTSFVEIKDFSQYDLHE